MGTTTTRTLHDRMGGVRRFMAALARDPHEWELDDLVRLRSLDIELDRVRAEAVMGLRETGHTDRQIGEALGITQQAVSKRWPGGGRYVGSAGRYRKPTTTTDRETEC